jgi:hypothetical protein
MKAVYGGSNGTRAALKMIAIALTVGMIAITASTASADVLCQRRLPKRSNYVATKAEQSRQPVKLFKRVVCPRGWRKITDITTTGDGTISSQGPAGATGATGATGAAGATGALQAPTERSAHRDQQVPRVQPANRVR